ncbi:MAG: Dabb family protein [Hyphomicrobiales bacterium]|nr:Dabb family protein [Hyphomicrobiales bacterium]
MHTHIVFFWLKEGLDEGDHERFFEGLDLLTRQQHVRDRRIGKPAATDRDVVDFSYAYSIVLRFDDLDARNAYQVSDEHQTFLDTRFDMIDRVQVYDVAEADTRT